ncbi:hypothetical protein Tco_0046419 [Tanacetum coccineum]
MSDSEDSTVTYTAVSSPFGGLSDIGSPKVDGPPVMLEDPYAYVVAAFQALPSPDYVPAEEQPLPAALSPTTISPGYVPESDPKEDPKDDDEEDPKEDPADYPVDGGDDGDDEDESSDDDEDDDVDIEGGEEEEEHPATADSTVVALPAVDHALSAEEIESFETDESAATPPPHPAYRVTARISIRDEPPIPFWSDTSPTYPLRYRGAMIRLRAEALSTSYSLLLPPPIILSHTRSDALSSGTPPLLPIPLPTSSPPLHLLFADRRADRPEVTLPPRKRLGIALGPRYKVGESSYAPTARPPGGIRADYGFVATMDKEIMRDLERDVGYRITDIWDEMLVDMPGAPETDDTELSRRMTEFYQLLGGGDVSDLARAEGMSLRTQVVPRQAVITELQAADRRRQAAITEMLVADRMRQAQFIEALKSLKKLQTQMTEFERQ